MAKIYNGIILTNDKKRDFEKEFAYCEGYEDWTDQFSDCYFEKGTQTALLKRRDGEMIIISKEDVKVQMKEFFDEINETDC